MGVIAVSAPKVKSPVPTTTLAAPSIKASIIPLSSGVTVMHKSITIIVMGKTEEKASFIFSEIMVLSVKKNPNLFFTSPPFSAEFYGKVKRTGTISNFLFPKEF